MKLLEEKLWGVEREELNDMVGLCQFVDRDCSVAQHPPETFSLDDLGSDQHIRHCMVHIMWNSVGR